MSRSNSSAITLLAGVLFTAASCTILPAQQDHSRFFILTSITDGTATTAPAIGTDPDIAIGIGPVKFPGYLKRPQIVTRVGADRVELSPTDRWAEPLDANFQRVLGQDLSQMLGTQRVAMFPWYGSTHIDYQVEVEVRRFDTGSDNRSQLDATWIIKDGTSGVELSSAQITTSSALSGSDGSGSAALSRDVSTLSRQIAERISELNKKRTIKSNPAGAANPGDDHTALLSGGSS